MCYKLCMSDRAEIRFARIGRNDKGFTTYFEKNDQILKKPDHYDI